MFARPRTFRPKALRPEGRAELGALPFLVRTVLPFSQRLRAPFADLLRALPGIEAPVEGAERGGDPASGAFGSSPFRDGLKSLALPTGLEPVFPP